MKEQTQSAIRLLEALTERAKELTCVYVIEEVLNEPEATIGQVCERIIRAIPPGWQFPEICVARITLEDKEYESPGFEETPWSLSAEIVEQDRVVGSVGVWYRRKAPAADVGPFLKEEQKLIRTIADRLGHYLTYKKMERVFHEWQNGDRDLSESRRGDWKAVLDLIRQTDNALFARISNKMLNHLCWSGIDEAEELRHQHVAQQANSGHEHEENAQQHELGWLLDFSTEFTERIFQIAASHLSDEEVLSRIQMWIQEDKLGFLLQTVHRHLPISEVAAALRRYFLTSREESGHRYPLARNLKVFLIARLLSDQLGYVKLAKDSVEIEDLYNLLQKVIFSVESQGRLGGKSAGFFLAGQILKKTKKGLDPSLPLRTPKTWYIPSDMMLHFIHYNKMDEIIGQKYKEIEKVRLEYPHVIDMLTQSVFPPDIVKGLSMALDDLGDSALVVRSSSLLEDRMGSAFVGKYKTVFLANRGSEKERLRDLMHAVAEVYASNFGPDPIEYRAERGLLDFSEQMGVMIQEVVGTRVGPYLLPTYSAVARSRNDFRWSPEIEEHDGVLHMVPGLGTRAADRTGDEQPMLIVPGRPSREGNPEQAEIVRRAPKRIDAINLETKRLETLDLQQLLRDHGDAYPGVEQIVSVYEEGRIRPLDPEKPDLETGQLVVTFDGLATRSPFAAQIRNLLRVLEAGLGLPVEIELASDGEHLYLLQCRPQTFAHVPRASAFPKDLLPEKALFSTSRHVSNGWASNITHVVYVDPVRYANLQDPEHRRAVEPALNRLNRVLPKRQFMILGPARRSSPGEGPRGLDLVYDDVANAAALVEIVMPERDAGRPFSFGVQFLQVLVESDIRYLPVFPDDRREVFNERFLEESPSVLAELLPEYAFLSDVVRVIDVPQTANGSVAQLLMNADLNKAMAFLTEAEEEIDAAENEEPFGDGHAESYWRWRQRMAEQVASRLAPERFGVADLYLFGSTKNGTAGPASDIDLLIHFRGSESQRRELLLWLEGWSLCLDEANYLRTGYRSGGLLDVHIVTDEDVAKRTSYAVKIDAVTDAARPLKMKETENRT
jgi:predicted nucleotidyltransferase